jgi:hypothetical protein
MIFTIQNAHIYRKIVINKYGNLSNYLIDCNLDFIDHLRGEVNELIEMEELKWHQRAQQNWLQYGDEDSKYFHTCVNQRRETNLI